MSEQVGRHLKDDPKKPFKAYAAGSAPAVLALITVLMNEGGADIWPPWVLLCLAAVAAFIATYYATNPKVKVNG